MGCGSAGACSGSAWCRLARFPAARARAMRASSSVRAIDAGPRARPECDRIGRRVLRRIGSNVGVNEPEKSGFDRFPTVEAHRSSRIRASSCSELQAAALTKSRGGPAALVQAGSSPDISESALAPANICYAEHDRRGSRNSGNTGPTGPSLARASSAKFRPRPWSLPGGRRMYRGHQRNDGTSHRTRRNTTTLR